MQRVRGKNIQAISAYPKWPLYTWFLFFVLSPFYVFGSGMPQPADWLVAILFLYIFLSGYIIVGKQYDKLVSTHLSFVIWVVIVNTLWSFLIDQSLEKRFPSYFHSLFYIFNFLAVRSYIVLAQQQGSKLILYTLYGVGFSLILQAGLSFSGGVVTSRDALFFNNPNQLGYYALLSGSILAYGARYIKIKLVFQVAAYFSFFYLTLVSSSKAAMAGALILVCLSVLNQGLLNFRQLFILVVAISMGFYFTTQNTVGTELFDYSIKRFDEIGASKDDTYEGRGYDRIVNDPEYMIVGAGEGGYYRFDTLLDAGEIHSSFGTIIFCYGIVGFLLFMRLLLLVFKGASVFELFYFIPVFAYSITHNGLRSTLFWVFLAVIFILNQHRIKIKNFNFAKTKRVIPNNNSSHVVKHPVKRPA